jgi:hypothetical protein
MANANNSSTYSMAARINAVEEVVFIVLEETPNCISAKIGELDAHGQAAIYEEWSFNNLRYTHPHRSTCMKMTHQLSESVGGRIIMVVRQQSNCARISDVH